MAIGLQSVVSRHKIIMVEIVPFSQMYANDVFELILSVQTVEFGVPLSIEAQPDLLDISDFYQKGNSNFWVALEKQKVIGTVALLDIGNEQAALRKMFVASKHRNREHGAASRLLETLFSWCRVHGVREVYLGTTAQFLAAHRFYEKNDFIEIARSKLSKAFSVMVVDTKFYCCAAQERKA